MPNFGKLPATEDTQINGNGKHFKLRGLGTNFGNYKTNDDIHQSISFCPVLKTIIDTPHVQRLRKLKQLGVSEVTYMNCNHNRFEHSMGVAHLAEQMLESIHRKQPQLGITPKDILCVKIAGLLHDLGHGPFSHVFDGEFPTQLEKALAQKHWLGRPFMSPSSHHHENSNHSLGSFGKSNTSISNAPSTQKKWKHEDASLMLIDSLLAHLGLRINKTSDDKLDEPLEQIGDGIDAKCFGITGNGVDGSQPLPHDRVLTSRDFIFIKECILGGPLPQDGYSVEASKEFEPPFIGRPDKYKEFLYDVVSNRHSGLDVDKIDYLARDSRRAFATAGEYDKKLIEEACVAWGKCAQPTKHKNDNDQKKPASIPVGGSPIRYQKSNDNNADGECKDDMHLMICYPEKLVQHAMRFFQQRFENHQKLYSHHNSKAAAYMVCDILLLAEPTFRISIEEEVESNDGVNNFMNGRRRIQRVPISQANLHAQAFLKLNDSILDIIGLSDCAELERARVLYNRFQARKFYKRVVQEPIVSKDCKSIDLGWHEMLWDSPESTIAEEIVKCARLNDEDKIISTDDIIIEKNEIHHGRGEDNPVNSLRFLPKSQSTKLFESPDNLPTAKAKSEKEYECAIPRAFLQRTLRIYSRSHDPSQTEFIKTCYYQYRVNLQKRCASEPRARPNDPPQDGGEGGWDEEEVHEPNVLSQSPTLAHDYNMSGAGIDDDEGDDSSGRPKKKSRGSFYHTVTSPTNNR